MNSGCSPKPWRRFLKAPRFPGIIRKLCYAALILEAAVILKDSSALVHVERQTSRQSFPAEEFYIELHETQGQSPANQDAANQFVSEPNVENHPVAKSSIERDQPAGGQSPEQRNPANHPIPNNSNPNPPNPTHPEKADSLPASILERYFGVHFRIKEGVVEFYHKEERQNFY